MANNSGVALCGDQLYGEIEESLFDTIGEFIIDKDLLFIFVVDEANVALDNIKISYTYNASDERRRRLLSSTTESPRTTTSTTNSYSWNNWDFPIKFGAIGGTTLIIDSELDEVECWYALEFKLFK